MSFHNPYGFMYPNYFHQAVRDLDGASIDGQPVRVELAKPREDDGRHR